MKRILLAGDYRSIQLKMDIYSYLKNKDYDVIDIGCTSIDALKSCYGEKDTSCSYVSIANKYADAYSINKDNYDTLGIVICGSGTGMSIACNKKKGIYAARCMYPVQAKLAREHNNCNTLALGVMDTELTSIPIYDTIDAFLEHNKDDVSRHKDVRNELYTMDNPR